MKGSFLLEPFFQKFPYSIAENCIPHIDTFEENDYTKEESGILSKYDGVSFAKSLGTVVTERLIDSLCVALITGTTLLLQAPVFATFFKETGTDVGRYTQLFTSANFYLLIVCIIALCLLAFFLIRNVAVFARLRGILHNVFEGILSLRKVKNLPLFLLYTIGIYIIAQ